jgi:membrane protein DedA with SNARE-associated domain
MKVPTTIVGRVRLAVAGLALIAGGGAALWGAVMTVLAMLTGRDDPRHGGAMILAGSVPLLIVGLVLLATAFLIWPRERRVTSNREPAA